jgi:chromosomal replication initiation ATPase DnaA
MYRFCDLTQPEIGRYVGGIDYSAVSQARKRLQEKMFADKKLKSQYHKTEEQIVNMSR